MALASEVLDRARRLIQDETSVRWPLIELALWLDDGQREIALQKPSAASDNRVLDLQAGTLQQLPEGAIQLLRVTRNIQSIDANGARNGGPVIRICSRDILDAQNRNWHDSRDVRYSRTVKHYVYDEEDTRSFYVYPGNDGTGKIEAVLAIDPPRIEPVRGKATDDIEAYAVALTLAGIYANALVDYVCYRAFAKDAQYAGNAQRAALHYQQFANAIGIKFNQEALASPNQSPRTGAD
ncbi:DUF6682 family protein [Sphingobium yanoikuyae]|uniref:Uncharacterized protein n=1 Tax=Sphingobium yanoikuyae TaxID=13690 RepID=A0A3G2UN05_SPHYA|nr:DUF6682 family protein [Sphingobium yanoikuyae]AYO76436.1 hypothetical protein EBF16_05445 [Sphingobium yanoikuyae]